MRNAESSLLRIAVGCILDRFGIVKMKGIPNLFLVLALALIAACGGASLDGGGASEQAPQSGSTVDGASVGNPSTTSGSGSRQLASNDPEPSTAVFEGLDYECDSGAGGRWDCARGAETLFCSGSEGPDDCSELWYPDELADVRLVVFEGQNYACALYDSDCVAYAGGPPPRSFYPTDLWCVGLVCSEYDPDAWFEITFEFHDYLCEQAMFGFQHFDCQQVLGATPASAMDPDLYCSGPQSLLDCSETWYPDDLDGFQVISLNGQDYLCEVAFTGRYGDLDCGRYDGGDPGYVITGSLKCTNRGYTYECDSQYYPSELDGLTLTYIGSSKYVCQDSYGGSECFLYYGGSPVQATYGPPDLYCNNAGLCDTYGYP